MARNKNAIKWMESYLATIDHAVRSLNAHGFTVESMSVCPRDIEVLEKIIEHNSFPDLVVPIEKISGVPITRDPEVEHNVFVPVTFMGGRTVEEAKDMMPRIFGQNAEEN